MGLAELLFKLFTLCDVLRYAKQVLRLSGFVQNRNLFGMKNPFLFVPGSDYLFRNVDKFIIIERLAIFCGIKIRIRLRE